MKPAFLLSLILLTATFSRAETTAELMERIKTAAKAEAKEAAKSKDPLAVHASSLLEQLVLEFDSPALDHPDFNLPRLVEQVEMTSNSNQLQELCRTTVKQMRAERQQKGAALAEEMRTGFGSVLKDALEAKETKALDVPLAKVQALVEKGRQQSWNNPELPTLIAQGADLQAFLGRWQQYLAGIRTYNADSRLHWLLEERSDFSAFIPRSELLARIAEIEKEYAGKTAATATQPSSPNDIYARAWTIIGGIHDFHDLDESMPKLEELMLKLGQSGSAVSLQGILDHLRTLQHAHLDLEKGLATNIPVTTFDYSTPSVTNAVYSLRAQLLLAALPRLLGVTGADLPQPGDNPPTYLNRIANQAREKENWPLLKRASEVAQSINIGLTPTRNDLQALQAYVAAIDQEEARLYPQAVRLYLTALQSGSQMISPAKIGDRLDAIRKNHAQEYEQGMEPDHNRSFPPGMRTPTGFQPGGAPSGGSNAPNMITVPPLPKKN